MAGQSSASPKHHPQPAPNHTTNLVFVDHEKMKLPNSKSSRKLGCLDKGTVGGGGVKKRWPEGRSQLVDPVHTRCTSVNTVHLQWM